ncbi:MAG TPA: FAD-dependent oxidoreductase [Candidatus Saccharimonadales bacterium]|nr:FAD-dependent oxidoreductase [Candidatus Saccharimonadales bacterium]
MASHNIVIVGGGFAGVKAALELAKDHRFSVSLISDHPDFRYYPTLYHTATGGKKAISSIPLKQVFERLPIHIEIDSVDDIDRHQQLVKTAGGKSFHYDGLILALGVKTNYFNIAGLQEHAFGIKTTEDAVALKNHLHKQLVDDNHVDFNYIVIGGGPTGVELAGSMVGYVNKIAEGHNLSNKKVHIDLVEASPRLLPRAPKKTSKKVAKHLHKLGIRLFLKTTVQAQTADQLTINGKALFSHTVIWTAGVANPPFFTKNNFQLSGNGRVRVNQFLQSEPGIYVLGDNADTPYAGLAQTAVLDGKFVAENLKRLAAGEDPKPYIAKRPIYVFPAGPKWAAVIWGQLQFYGRVGSWLRKIADLVGYHDYEPWKYATELLMSESETEESCPICSKD